jgi:PAS domain S-box-containing protein
MKGEKKEFKILVIEDNPGDFALIEDFLFEQIEKLQIVRAKNYREAVQALSSTNNKFDVVLLDLSLPDKTGLSLINEITSLCINIPVIVLTGYTDLEFGVRSLSMGISDYHLKEELTAMSLYKSILYSLERKKSLYELVDSEKKYSELFHMNPQPMYVFEPDTQNFLNVNNAAIEHYGYSREEFLSMKLNDITVVAGIENDADEELIKDGLACQGNFTHRKKNGEHIRIDTQSNVIDYKGAKAIVVLAIDVTERLNYIKAIEEQNQKLKEISWIQSHVVRAPLARIMGLIQILKDSTDKDEKLKMMDYILVSANELDDKIKDITNKTMIVQEGVYPEF